MKYWYIGGLALAALAGILLFRYKNRHTTTDHIDGGVRHLEDQDASKEIRSTQITDFHCTFSTRDLCREDSPIAGQIFTLTADAQTASLRLRNRSAQFPEGEFIPDQAFFEQLQQIVSGYGFAQYNGKHYTVSGLPPDYGIRLTIRYASGETICASNNQDCFLPVPAMEALVALFQQKPV